LGNARKERCYAIEKRKDKREKIKKFCSYSAWFFLPLKHQGTKSHKESRYCLYVDRFITIKNLLHLSMAIDRCSFSLCFIVPLQFC